MLANLKSKGFDVVPINPRETEILGLEVFSDLKSCPKKTDVVVFVVPPKIAFNILKSTFLLGIKKFWFQPGSESNEALKFCRINSLECTQACMIIKTDLKTS